MGITRVANVTGLDSVGIPVVGLGETSRIAFDESIEQLANGFSAAHPTLLRDGCAQAGAAARLQSAVYSPPDTPKKLDEIAAEDRGDVRFRVTAFCKKLIEGSPLGDGVEVRGRLLEAKCAI